MELRNISKRYGEKMVFSHFSCTIPDGSSRGVMAPSGAGKTTLLRLILGLEKPDEGEILGVPGGKSVLFQEDRLFPQLSAVKNIRMAVPRCSVEEARGLLEALGLETAWSSRFPPSPAVRPGGQPWPGPWPARASCWPWTSPSPAWTKKAASKPPGPSANTAGAAL